MPTNALVSFHRRDQKRGPEEVLGRLGGPAVLDVGLVGARVDFRKLRCDTGSPDALTVTGVDENGAVGSVVKNGPSVVRDGQSVGMRRIFRLRLSDMATAPSGSEVFLSTIRDDDNGLHGSRFAVDGGSALERATSVHMFETLTSA